MDVTCIHAYIALQFQSYTCLYSTAIPIMQLLRSVKVIGSNSCKLAIQKRSNLDDNLDSKSILSFLLQGKFSDLWVGFCKGKTSEICRRFLTGQRDSPMF